MAATETYPDELRYHPEQYIDLSSSNGDAARAAPIVAEKRRWLGTPQTFENARVRHLGITGANQALQPYVMPLRDEIERERNALQLRKRGDAILRSREYSFCLYPRKHFDRLLMEPQL